MSAEEARPIRSDLARIDAHEITAEEYAEVPELDDAFFERADLYEGDRLIRRGRRANDDETHPERV
ncbi:hypothetical protein [Salinarimonas ramus]|uniref:Uncharacterized protein n=1 Tax=Salinarimonas ramus TaxID=690164 RepID=A0A917Q6G6_9HYPH|nr:hypothetical protein [Salinarimonas ramus]GGK29332.1 hypothetical protein GCM10011322_14650 [Salinarimonas ramus]